MMEFLAKALAELVFRCCVALIERVASSQYANDVLDALHARWERSGAVGAAHSALRSLPTAIGSRLRSVPPILGASPQILFAPISYAAPAFFFATTFCCYQALVASPMFTFLERSARFLPTDVSAILLICCGALGLVAWRRTRAKSASLLLSVAFAAIVSPAFLSALRFLFQALELHASGIVAVALIGLVTVWVFLRVRRLSIILEDSPFEGEREMVGFICFALAAARVMFVVHDTFGHGAGPAQIASTLAREGALSLAVTCVLALVVTRVQLWLDLPRQPRFGHIGFTLWPWAWEGEYDIRKPATEHEARVRAAITHHVERGLWGDVVYRRGGRL